MGSLQHVNPESHEYNKAHVAARGDEYTKMRAAYREKNRQRINAYAADYYAKNAEERRAYAKANREQNPEQRRQACRQWRAENPDKQKEAVERWRLENPQADTVHRNRRRARKASVGGKLSADIVAVLTKRQGGKCAYCGECLSKGRHLDHKTPLSRGGANDDENVQLTCPPCNLSKHAKTHEEFLHVRANS